MKSNYLPMILVIGVTSAGLYWILNTRGAVKRGDKVTSFEQPQELGKVNQKATSIQPVQPDSQPVAENLNTEKLIDGKTPVAKQSSTEKAARTHTNSKVDKLDFQMQLRLQNYLTHIPSLKEYRKQAQTEGDMPALPQDFIGETSEFMIYSRDNATFAKKFGERLAECSVQESDIPPTIQLYCFQNLKTLTQNHPGEELKNLMVKAESKLPGAVKRLNRAFENL